MTTLVVLLANSAGCVSWKHLLNRDSRRAIVAAEHIGTVYHSPLCGQILPDGHFIKCPGCLQAPVYPEFAMVASDEPLEEPLMDAPSEVSSGDDDESDEQSDDAEEIVTPAPDRIEVSVPTLPADIAMIEVTDFSALEPSQSAHAVVAAVDLAQSPTTEPVIAARVAFEPCIVAQSQREIQASEAVVAEPAATEPAEAKPAPVATVVQENEEVAAESLSISVLDLGYSQLGVSQAEFTPLEKAADAEDVFEIVKRIPIPSTKTDLVTEVSGDDKDIDSGDEIHTHRLDNSSNVGVWNEAPIASSIVRTPAAMIEVTTEGDQPTPSSPDAPKTGIKPYDEQGPIPIRKVRTGAQPVLLPKAVDSAEYKSPIDHANGKSILKANVAKVTAEQYPTSIKPIAQPQRERDDHPYPVRRIKLPEFPVTIQR